MTRAAGKNISTFDVMIVPEDYFLENPVCPYCDSPSHPELNEMVGEMGMRVVADIMQCADCAQPYLVVEHPRISAKQPIKTRWTLTE